ncbi:MAG: amino acid transporter, partial [Chitinophagales bacterium]|nr:amino acid transporter [Chitinophagales bacterium]
IGTLSAFLLVSIGVWIMRVKEPGLKRAFRTPWVPFVPIMGIIVCAAMMFGLDEQTWMGFLAWTALGLVVYFFYSRHHSVAGKESTGK